MCGPGETPLFHHLNTFRLPTSLDLAKLAAGYTGISAVGGAALAEAARVSLEAQSHISPCAFEVRGAIEAAHTVAWEPCDDAMLRFWADLDEAAEHGAYGIAALLMDEHTDLEVVERSRKGTGFDFWLGKKGDDASLFQYAARMEVSSIQQGNDSTIRYRERQKLKQTSPTDGTLPAYIVVVEYSAPLAQIASK